jgi:hypothetical protein
MSTVGNLALTMTDFRKRMTPDGQLDYIIECLAESNPILEDMKWMEGNLPTGIQTTQRTSIPTPSVRVINRGVAASKSTTEQITDTCMMLEDRSQIDVKLLQLQANKEAFRKSEDAAHMEGLAQKVARVSMYGDIKDDPDEFNGLSVRYKTFSGAKGDAGYQVIPAGTAGEKTNTSAFLVGWGERATAGIYPKNTQVGLKMTDLGESDVFDKDGRPFRAVQTLFEWNCGLTVRDVRANALVRNINVATLASLTSANKLALIEKFTKAKNRIRNLRQVGTKFSWYVSDSVYDFIECFLTDKNNVHVTRQEVMGQMPQLYLGGIKVQKLDCIKEDEEAIV